MKDVTKRIYIYTSWKDTQDEMYNRLKIDEEVKFLNEELKLNTTLVRGKYAGKEEESIWITSTNTLEPIIKERAKLHTQDCYLIVYDDNAVELVFGTGNRMFIGQWTEVVNKPTNDYTYNPVTNKYYTVK